MKTKSKPKKLKIDKQNTAFTKDEIKELGKTKAHFIFENGKFKFINE
jgi:hypothetical protein